jgi:dimethylargininase
MLRSEGDRLSCAIVCTPTDEYYRVRDLRAHNIVQRAHRDRAMHQHDALKAALRAFGAKVVDLPELANHPNSVFTRDAGLCTPGGYIKLRLGIATRRGEAAWMARALDALGEPRAGEITAPGTVDGGDVVLAGSVAFVGHSVRTNREGVQQLAAHLEPMGCEVRTISLPDAILHLDKVLIAVAPDRILYCSEYVDEGVTKGFHTIDIPFGDAATANVICLGENQVIVERSNKRAIDALTANGLVVHQLDLSEFVKGSGGPNCLIMPVERT